MCVEETVDVGLCEEASNQALLNELDQEGPQWDEAKAQHFLNLCSEAHTLVDGSYTVAEARVHEIAVAYQLAWNQHVGALNKASARQQLTANLILSGALTFAAGFAGPYVAAVMTRLVTTKPIVDGIVQFVKWGIQKAGTAASPPSEPALKAFPTDPLAWQNQVEARILQEKAGVYAVLRWWQNRVNAKDPAFNLDFDPRAELQSVLIVGGVPMNKLPPINVEQHASEIEKGFWAKWCELYGYQVTVTFGGVYIAEEAVPKEGEERLVELLGSEEAARQFVVSHGAQAREAAEQEAMELNAIRPPMPLY